MIYRDSSGFLVKGELKDGGDTAVREGLMAVFTGQPGNLLKLVDESGICFRHPIQKPWNNPNNFTKDQLKCLVAGLYAIGRHDVIKLIYEAHKERNWFCQNSERDFPGSKKHPFPHYAQDFSKNDELGNDITKKGDPEFRWFDHSDLLLPNDILFLQVAARVQERVMFGEWFHNMAIRTHAKSNHDEENQMFSECYVLGTLQKYIELNPLWQSRDWKYWFNSDRNETEYHDMKVKFVRERTK